jgi:hypothetical protein
MKAINMRANPLAAMTAAMMVTLVGFRWVEEDWTTDIAVAVSELDKVADLWGDADWRGDVDWGGDVDGGGDMDWGGGMDWGDEDWGAEDWGGDVDWRGDDGTEGDWADKSVLRWVKISFGD